MSDREPDGPYVYQPFAVNDRVRGVSGRLFAVGGLPMAATVAGLTRAEAEACCLALLPPSGGNSLPDFWTAEKQLPFVAKRVTTLEVEVTRLQQQLANLRLSKEDDLARKDAQLAASQAEAEGLRQALTKLVNEVDGLQAFITREQGDVRDVIGQTNWNVLMMRAVEAREALSPAPSGEGGVDALLRHF